MAYEVLSYGAESVVYIGYILGRRVVVKERISKPYRNPKFDEEFRRYRTRIEAKILSDLCNAGVNVPKPLIVDLKNYIIVMEYIDGVKMIDLINDLKTDEIEYYAYNIGRQLGRIHSLDIYHGDFTLGNLLVTSDRKVYIIDFGLAGYSRDIEEYAIDLHLLRRNILAVYPDILDLFMNSVKKGYVETYSKDSELVFKRLEEIRLRGRYVEERLKKRLEREKYIE